jgi:hypothetical protein
MSERFAHESAAMPVKSGIGAGIIGTSAVRPRITQNHAKGPTRFFGQHGRRFLYFIWHYSDWTLINAPPGRHGDHCLVQAAAWNPDELEYHEAAVGKRRRSKRNTSHKML